MNTLQTTLSALEAKLLTQKQATIDYETNVFDVQMSQLTEKISKWLKENVDVHNQISFTCHCLKVMCENGHNNTIDVYYRTSWREDVNNTVEGKTKLSWYGSSCDIEDTVRLGYLITLGKIAGSLREIQKQQHEWYKEARSYEKAKSEYYEEIRNIEYAIQNTKQSIKKDDIESYKKVGFKCELKPYVKVKRDYDQAGYPYVLSKFNKSIEFYFGYGKWDYVYVKSFEIVKQLNRGKLLFKCIQSDDRVIDVEATPKFFNEFIEKVYDWQTREADENKERETKRFKSYTIGAFNAA
jgi:hypothetical protein